MNNIDYKAVVQILEDFLKQEKVEILGISVGQERQVRTAIENLIQEIKELKEKRKNTMALIGANYIHKDKVKEKIKELDKKMAEDEVDEFGIHSQGWAALDWTRDFLLELLEEGE